MSIVTGGRDNPNHLCSMGLQIVTDCDAAKAITEQLSRPPDNRGRSPPGTYELAAYRGRLRHDDNPKAKVPPKKRLQIPVTEENRFDWYWRWFADSRDGDHESVRKDRLTDVRRTRILIGGTEPRWVSVPKLAKPLDHRAAILAGHWSPLANRPPRPWILNSRGEPIDDVIGLGRWKPGTKAIKAPARSQVVEVNGVDRCAEKELTEGPPGHWITVDGLPGQGAAWPPFGDPPPLLIGWERTDRMLSPEEEHELVHRVQTEQPSGWCGRYPARNELVRQFFYLINREARGKDFRGVPKSDLHMAGVVAVLDRVSAFDPSRRKRLSSYVTERIHGAMLDERKQWEKQGRHGETRDERWLMANHYKYADRQLIGGGYSASYNDTLILVLMAAMARPNDGIKDYTRERAIKAIGDFEAAQAGQSHYDTTAEGGYADDIDQAPVRGPIATDDESAGGLAFAVSGDEIDVLVRAALMRGQDAYSRHTDEVWLAYCRQRRRARYTDAKGMYAYRIDGATGKAYTVWLLSWDAHIERRGTASGFRTHPAPLRQVGRLQYEADQRMAHGVYEFATRFKLRTKATRNWVFTPATVVPLDVLLQLAAADAAERRSHGEIAEASVEGCVRLEPV
jgi:hypothetical protein